MKILATFANRTYYPEGVELVDAWDEYCVESNPDGFEESRKKALESWSTDLLRWVTVEIEVPMADIYAVLDPEITVPGTVGEVVAYEQRGDFD